jgi:hypothetical protein
VGAQRSHVVGGRLAIRERRQQRRQAIALGAGLDPRDACQERAATLGQTPVDLGKWSSLRATSSQPGSIATPGRCGANDMRSRFS